MKLGKKFASLTSFDKPGGGIHVSFLFVDTTKLRDTTQETELKDFKGLVGKMIYQGKPPLNFR